MKDCWRLQNPETRRRICIFRNREWRGVALTIMTSCGLTQHDVTEKRGARTKWVLIFSEEGGDASSAKMMTSVFGELRWMRCATGCVLARAKIIQKTLQRWDHQHLFFFFWGQHSFSSPRDEEIHNCQVGSGKRGTPKKMQIMQHVLTRKKKEVEEAKKMMMRQSSAKRRRSPT